VIPKAIAPEVFFASVTDTRTDQTVFSSRILSNQGAASSQARDRMVAEDDGVGWINAGNIDSFRVSGSGILSTAAGSDRAQRVPVPVVATRVACVTTDFTMQNVLLQMNLGVASVDGLLVREVRQWVLRCSACLKVHAAMDRLFCSKCGASHLQRIAASVSAETGELRLHLKRGHRVSSRGKVHPLPKPGSQGKYAGELLLREDQLLSGVWRQKVVKVNRDVRSAFGADVVSDVGLQLNKSAAIKVGLGRTNPNADKGRNKRGSKHRKR
jgi:RNA-binding protein NOB1